MSRSTVKIWVTCDRCGTSEEFIITGTQRGDDWNQADLAGMLAFDGWTGEEDEDFCPACTKEIFEDVDDDRS